MRFEKINLVLHKEVAIQFMADCCEISFGTDRDFWEEDNQGGERYIEWLKSKMQNPQKFGAFHIWRREEIIGQMELGLFKDDESWGNVHFYYLREDCRGQGLSKELDDFVVQFLKGLGVHKAKLSVSPTNLRALKFYQKNGWIDKGPREKRSGQNLVYLMEKVFAP